MAGYRETILGLVGAAAFGSGLYVLSSGLVGSQDQQSTASLAISDIELAAATALCSAEDVYGTGEMAHAHQTLEVAPDAPLPAVTHLVFPDDVDGYNVQILTENFEFAPASINSEAVSNEGHAHIYVNGVKTARVYGNWYHLPSDALAPGVNVVSVTLNANDHSEWAIDGVPIASSVRVVRPEE